MGLCLHGCARDSISMTLCLTPCMRTPGDIGAALATACGDPPIPANLQVGLRLACNTFRHESLRAWVVSNQAALLDAFAPACTSPLKPVRLALATFLLNLSALLRSSPHQVCHYLRALPSRGKRPLQQIKNMVPCFCPCTIGSTPAEFLLLPL